jgi:voltage-gated potassium channel
MAGKATAGGELKDTGYEIFIAALSVLSIVNMVLAVAVRSEAMSAVLIVIDWILSLVLLGDFVYRLSTAPSPSRYFFREFGWADLLASLPLANLKFLRVFRLVRVYRLLRATGVRRVVVSLVRDRAGSALLSLLLVAILVLEFGSLAVLSAEEDAAGANITTASDAIWYLIVTMSTVGYGDQYPVTATGRVIGSMVIVIGVGIFGTLTGFLANAFLGSPDLEEPSADPVSGSCVAEPGPPAPDPGTEAASAFDGPGSAALDPGVDAELRELREQHRAALERIDRLLSDGA